MTVHPHLKINEWMHHTFQCDISFTELTHVKMDNMISAAEMAYIDEWRLKEMDLCIFVFNHMLEFQTFFFTQRDNYITRLCVRWLS